MTFSSETSLYEDFVTSDSTNFDENAIKNAIRNILLTEKGSMVGRPSFGSRLYKIPFNLNDCNTQLLAKRLVFEALQKWENRIVLTNIEFPVMSQNNLVVKIDYYFKDATLKSSVSVSLLE